MAKTSDNSKNTKKKAAAGTRKPAASKPKKTAKTEKKAKGSGTSASAGWREKKAELRRSGREPKTRAERKQLEERGAVGQFFTKHSGIFDLFSVPFALFSAMCLISLATGNEREAAVWSVNMSRRLFGGICFLLYLWIIVFCFRLWLRNTRRFKTVHYRRYLYFLGLYFFLTLILQYTAGKQIPPLPPEEAGGIIAEAVISAVRNILGNSGVVILILSLFLFFLWQAWKFLAAMDKAQKSKENVVPVRLYWEDVHTAAEAEALEAEKQKAELTSDIEEDFRSSMGRMSPQEEEEPAPGLREEAENTLRKLRDTFKEIARPIPDREAMIPGEAPQKEAPRTRPAQTAEKKQTAEKAPRRTGKNKSETVRQLPLTPAVPEEPAEEDEEPISEPVFEKERDHNGSGLLSAPAAPKPAPKEKPKEEIRVRSHKVRLDEANETVITTNHDVSFVPTVTPSGKEIPAEPVPADPWILPDISKILDPVKDIRQTDPADDPEIREQSKKIEEILAKHEANSTVVDIQRGTTFTQFGVEPGFVEKGNRKTKVRVSKIESLKKDLEMALKVKKLSIVAPIPNKTFIGLQVQNAERQPVYLREVIESEKFRSKKWYLGIALGKDINGETFSADLTRMPHLLIAGATGSGKSVCLNSILVSLLMFNSPTRLKLILIDPKRVELSSYNGIPHMITPPVTEPENVGNILQWVQREMEMRNLHFMENGVRNIQEYNVKFVTKPLPYILIVIDELADLMSHAASDVETSIMRLAQMGRAMGIHLIVATQHPSHDVITGTVKGNLPTRIALSVSSPSASHVIMSRKGAEDLFGNGDMYYLSSEEIDLKRLQGVYVSDSEILRLTDYWRSNPRSDAPAEEQDPDLVKVPQPVTETVMRQPQTFNGTLTQLPLFNESAPPLNTSEDRDYDTAVKLVQREGRAAQNMLVTKMGIGFPKAIKLLARMEEDGIVSEPDPVTGKREVLDFGKYGPVNDGEKD